MVIGGNLYFTYASGNNVPQASEDEWVVGPGHIWSGNFLVFNLGSPY